MSLRVKVINAGIAKGPLLVSPEPISFFGGVDSATGIVVERNHPLEGESISNKILVLPSGKGSTVGSYVIYGLAKKGRAPRGIVIGRADSIISAGAILSGIPVAIADIKRLSSLFKNGEMIVLDAKRGKITRYFVKGRS
jgi:predicted aconitase with swiveling domain